jgi:hypothetical protein
MQYNKPVLVYTKETAIRPITPYNRHELFKHGFVYEPAIFNRHGYITSARLGEYPQLVNVKLVSFKLAFIY